MKTEETRLVDGVFAQSEADALRVILSHVKETDGNLFSQIVAGIDTYEKRHLLKQKKFELIKQRKIQVGYFNLLKLITHDLVTNAEKAIESSVAQELIWITQGLNSLQRERHRKAIQIRRGYYPGELELSSSSRAAGFFTIRRLLRNVQQDTIDRVSRKSDFPRC